jgi:hypothetical protein
MKKRWKRVLRFGGLALAGALLLIIVFSLYVYFHKPALKGYIERTLSKRPGLTVEIGRLNYRLFPLRAEADSVKVTFVSALGRADVFIGRAETRGGLKRILGNQKPFLDHLTVSGLKIDFAEDPNAPPSGPIDVAGLSRTISDYLEYVTAISVKDCVLHLGLPVEGMDIAATGVDLRASGGGKTAVGLTAGRLDFRNDKPAAVLAASLRLDASWPRDGPFQADGGLELKAASVSLPDKNWAMAGLSLGAGFRGDEKKVWLSELALDVPDLVGLSGTAQVELGKNPVITVSSKLTIENIESAKKALAPFAPPDLPSFTLDGRVEWEGDVRDEMASGTAGISVKGTLRLPSARLKLMRDGLSVDQALRAELRLEGGPKSLRAAGFLDGSRGEVVASGVKINGLSFRLPVDVEGSRVSIPSFTAKTKGVVLSEQDRALKLDDLTMNGRMIFDYRSRSAEIGALSVEIPRLGEFKVAGTAESGPKGRMSLNLTSRNLDLGGLLAYFPTFVPEALSAWQPKGQADLTLEVKSATSGSGGYKLTGALDLMKAAFQDATGTIVSEGLEPRLRIGADIPASAFSPTATPTAPIHFSLELGLAQGESLLKDAYFNWQNDPLRLALSGALDLKSSEVRDAAAVISFPALGGLRAEGSVSFLATPSIALKLAAPSIDLARLYAFMGKMRPTQPSSLEVRGEAAAEADVRFGKSLRIGGKLRVREAEAKQKDGSFAVTGLEVDFPFLVSNGVRPGDEKEDTLFSAGHVRVNQIKTPAETLDSLRVDFYSARNLFLLFPVEVELWGARLRLGKTVVSLSPASFGLRGVSTLALSDLDFSKLPFNSESFKLEGKASIPENDLEITPREFRFKGRMLAEMFGGRMTLDGIRVTDVFSSGRRIMLQAEIEELDLGKLTDAVPFGAVTGIVDILLDDLALSYGQPESFSLTVRSVPRKGVSRKFSLKAVDNLSVISSGGQAAAPSRSFLTKLVNSFNYRQIGIACSLKNDVFTLRGTIVEGGVQYLVRRAAFFGIDVVNAKPVNTISFKDMLGRLERVGKSQEKK